MTLLTDMFEEEQFIAGEYVAWGTYQRVGTNVQIRFDNAGYLPFSTDGKMCAYFRIEEKATGARSEETRQQVEALAF